MYIKPLTIPPVIEKSIHTPSGKTTLITLLTKYTTISYYMQLNFQDKAMTFINPFDMKSTFYQLIAHFEASRCMIKFKKAPNSIASFSLARQLLI